MTSDLNPGLSDSVQGTFYLSLSFKVRMCAVFLLGCKLTEGRELLVLTQCSAQHLGPQQCWRMLLKEIVPFSSLVRKCGAKATVRASGEGLTPQGLSY